MKQNLIEGNNFFLQKEKIEKNKLKPYDIKKNTKEYFSLLINKILKNEHEDKLIINFQKIIALKGQEDKKEILFRTGYLNPSILNHIDEKTLNLLLLKMVEKVLTKNKEIKEVGHITFNFEKCNLEDETIIYSIIALVDGHGFDLSQFTVEILETVDLENEKVIKNISRMKEIGLKIALDDFGANKNDFKRLEMLIEKNLLDIVKIDRVHFNKVKKTQHFKTLITILKRYGLEIIVEGIETKEDDDIIRELDVDYVQGYYYDRPSSLKEFLENEKR